MPADPSDRSARASEGRRDTVQVLRRSSEILDCFSMVSPRLRAADIHQRTGLPTSTVGRILGTMVEEGLLHRQADLYSIGLRVTGWSAAASAGSDLITAAIGPVNTLRDKSGETSGIIVRSGHTRVVIHQVPSRHQIIFHAYVGQTFPLGVGAAGRVLMAFDDQARAAVLSVTPSPGTEAVRSAKHLERELAEIRRRGWSFTEEDREPGLNSLAAPIFDPTGTIIACVAIGGPSFRMSVEESERQSEMVVACATAVSAALR